MIHGRSLRQIFLVGKVLNRETLVFYTGVIPLAPADILEKKKKKKKKNTKKKYLKDVEALRLT